jgi:hypothetical protein
MKEPSYIIRLNIRCYQELLAPGATTEIRPMAIKLLAEALAQLPLAEAEESACGRQSGFAAA